MKITHIEPILLTGPSTLDPYLSAAMKHRCVALIQIVVDKGETGLGETYLGTFWPEVVPLALDWFRPILVGQSPEDIDVLFGRMEKSTSYFGRAGLIRPIINGIEAALLDLMGKVRGVPVYELLGGRQHDRMPCYATGGPSNFPLEKLAEKVQYNIDHGFRAVKIGGGKFINGDQLQSTDPDEAADCEREKLAFLRKRFGDGIGIALDGHMDCRPPEQTWCLETAKAVAKACESYDLLFFEEPLPYSDPLAYRALCDSTSVPIAGGECLAGRYEWDPYIRADAFDIAQPDAAFTGGLKLCVDIADELKVRNRRVAMHCWAAGVGLMQNIHAAFACANCTIAENICKPGPLYAELMVEPLRMVDGLLLPPDAPGLGVQITDRTRERFPFIPGTGQFASVPGKVYLHDRCLSWDVS